VVPSANKILSHEGESGYCQVRTEKIFQCEASKADATTEVPGKSVIEVEGVEDTLATEFSVHGASRVVLFLGLRYNLLAETGNKSYDCDNDRSHVFIPFLKC